MYIYGCIRNEIMYVYFVHHFMQKYDYVFALLILLCIYYTAYIFIHCNHIFCERIFYFQKNVTLQVITQAGGGLYHKSF